MKMDTSQQKDEKLYEKLKLASFFNPILGREAHAEGQGAAHRYQQAETIIFILTIFWPSSPCKFGKVCQDQLES